MKTNLQVNQTNGRVNLNIKPPKVSVKSDLAADYKLNQKQGKIKIETKDAKLDISNRKARAALDHKFYKVYSKEIAQKGIQDSMKAIKKYAKEGDQLAKIEKKGNPLISQAEKNSKSPKKKIGLKWKPGPEINYTPGNIKIDYIPGKIDTEIKAHWPETNLDRGKVEAYLNPKPKIEIKAVDVKV